MHNAIRPVLDFCAARNSFWPAQNSMPLTFIVYGVAIVAEWLLLQPRLARAASFNQQGARSWLRCRSFVSLKQIGSQIRLVLRKEIKEAALRKSQEGAPRPTTGSGAVSLPLVVRPGFCEELVHRGYRGRTRLASVGIKVSAHAQAGTAWSTPESAHWPLRCLHCLTK